MTGKQVNIDNPDSLRKLPDGELQAILLEGVSRTFALTIPQLPDDLYSPVANAYLLCRIVDTIEDETSLSPAQKEHFCLDFIKVVNAEMAAQPFTDELAPLLSEQTIPAEHSLIHLIPRIITITHRFDTAQIEALSTCVTTMAKGMPTFQAQNLQYGLSTMADMDEYCYFVAGCVGEMLAKLFCHYSPEIAVHKEQLLKLSVSFGQGLQMTNILKDIWDDAKRDVCWLPQDIFTATGYQLKDLQAGTNNAQFQLGLERLINIARNHLQDALTYTLLIPRHESGIRNFCLWALGMALLTLKKIKHRLDFTDSRQVKISRSHVKYTILTTRLTGRSNLLLSMLFNLTSRELTIPNWDYSPSTSTSQT